jgi:class 3 adenylate cyclase
MKVEDFFNQNNVLDLSFFNFRNAITAAYFATENLEILRVNDNFKKFFPVLGSVTNAYFPEVLQQLGVSAKLIADFERGINEDGQVLIPQISIEIDGQNRVYSLLSTRTTDDSFSYMNGVQGQFVDRTAEWELRHEREQLLEQKIQDREIIEAKSRQLEELASRLAKYLSPQVYESIFADNQDASASISRKNLTLFFSDIEKFTDLSDTLEPERLASIINSYLSEMASIAINYGGTVDKFIGDAVMVFYGDPESEGDLQDALSCIDMGLAMIQRTEQLQKHWKKLGVTNGLNVRMGIATGFCTVGNFGSEQRMDYTVLGSPVNMAARLQALAPQNTILIAESTYQLVDEYVDCEKFDEITPKGFARPVQVYLVKGFKSEDDRETRQQLSMIRDHVEVNVHDSSDIRAAIEELRQIQMEFEKQLASAPAKGKNTTKGDSK